MPKVQDMHADGPLRSACIRLDTTGRADLRRCDLEPTVGPLLLPWQSLGAACTHVWLDTADTYSAMGGMCALGDVLWFDHRFAGCAYGRSSQISG